MAHLWQPGGTGVSLKLNGCFHHWANSKNEFMGGRESWRRRVAGAQGPGPGPQTPHLCLTHLVHLVILS